MPSMMCPRCRGLKDMRVEVSRREQRETGGKPRKFETWTYTCSACNITVWSEDLEVGEKV